MKTIITTKNSNKDYFSAEAFYYIEQAEEYGYEIGKDFDFIIEDSDEDKDYIKVTIMEKDITVSVENKWLQFDGGYVLSDFLIKTTDIKEVTITF